MTTTMMTRTEIERNEQAHLAAEGGADARLIDVFSRRETERERRMRIARIRIDDARARVLRAAMGM